MGYCTYTQVQLLVNTAMATADITSIIVQTDAELDLMLDGSGMSSALKTSCSMRLAAIAVANRDPVSYGVGSTRAEMGRQKDIWQSEVDRLLRYAKVGVKVA